MDGTRHASLRLVSYQNHLAAIKIQKVWRGHRKRVELWKYGGILMVAQVAKIQRCYRGLQGRRKAAEVYRNKILRCAHKIQGLYYRWHSRRLRLRSHLNFLNRGVTLLQSYFRMRAAIHFTNVVRRALHNKKAGMIQRQVRRLLGLRRMQERRRRYKFIYNRLLRHIRVAIQALSNTHTETDEVVTNNSESPLFLLTNEVVDSSAGAAATTGPQKPPLNHLENQVEAFDFALCNLLALGRYEIVRRLGWLMALAANSQHSSCVTGSGGGGVAQWRQSWLQPQRAPGCVGDESELALTTVYLGLSACWTRAGRMRYTRADYMEEALGLMMQHSAVAMVRAQRQVQVLAQMYHSGALSIDETALPFKCVSPTSRRRKGRNVVGRVGGEGVGHGAVFSGLPSDPNALPPWLLDMDEETVDLYYMSILAMHGVTSPYDAMLMMADWVWYQACIHEHNAAAEDMVAMSAAAIRASLREARAIDTARSATTDGSRGKSTKKSPSKRRVSGEYSISSSGTVPANAPPPTPAESENASLASAAVPVVAVAPVQAPTAPPPGHFSLADLVVKQVAGELSEVPEAPPAYVDPTYAEHEERMREAAFRRHVAVRRVYGLLQRAKRLLSAESADRKEITDRLDLFHDLHMTEHRSILADKRSHPMPFRAHFYSAQETIERQRAMAAASQASSGGKVVGKGVGGGQGLGAPVIGQAIAGTVGWMPGQQSTGSGALEVDLQIIQCGKTVLVKGSVLLHRLVEAVDDLPPGSTLSTTAGPSASPPGKSTKSAKHKNKSTSSKSSKLKVPSYLDPAEGEAGVPLQIAVRPFVLLRSEVGQLMDLINEELGILDIVGSAEAHEEGSEASSSLAGSTAGSLTASQTGSQSQATQQTGASGVQQHRHHHHHHHGFTVGEYRRLSEYLQQHLRLVSCTDSFVDPLLNSTVKEMRQLARERLGLSTYTYSNVDEHTSTAASRALSPTTHLVGSAKNTGEVGDIYPGVPNVRFSLPVLEYKRRIFNESQTVVHATHLLQRVYRGYQGRAKFRRMHWKRQEYDRQAQSTLAIRAAHDAVRFWRGTRLTVVQRLFRGYRWRKRLYQMKCASLVVQCAFRMHRARKIVSAERRRRAEGAPVVPMLGHGRGVQIGDIKFTLKIYRSGTNYRLEGLDFLRGVTYEGAVYTPEVMELIKTHNSSIVGTTLYANSQRIMPWQHERVTELIIANLGLMPKIAAVSTQLGYRAPTQATQYILVANKAASTTTAPVQPPPTQHQLHGSVSQSILELATAHTQKQRLQRYAQFRQERKFRRQTPAK